MDKIKLPFYLKFSHIVIGIIGSVFILYVSGDIIVPVLFAGIIAILLNPVVNYLQSKNVNRVIAIIIALIAGLIIIGALIYFLVWQITYFSDSFPALKDKFNLLTVQAMEWIAGMLNIPSDRVNVWLLTLRSELTKNTSSAIGKTLSTVSSIFLVGFLLPIYTFTILYYKPLFLQFFAKSFSTGNQKTVGEVLVETKTVIQSYLIGLMIELAIVSALNAVGLLIIGVKYAILLGVIGGLLNMIPYIGGIVAVALPMLMALATQQPIAVLWVLILYAVVQFIDNQYITPYIVGSKVKINGFVSILVVLIGGALWGVAGMFLSIPLIAIVKVVFDRIEELKPFGFLLGDDMPQDGTGIFKFPKPAILKKKKV